MGTASWRQLTRFVRVAPVGQAVAARRCLQSSEHCIQGGLKVTGVVVESWSQEVAGMSRKPVLANTAPNPNPATQSTREQGRNRR